MISSSPATDVLWLDTLHRVCGRVAHELKGALNGVAVNLEVVRSRAARPESPASAVASFATSASTQFEAVIDMTEALLALTRPVRGRVDLGATVRRFEALLAPAARVDGRELRVDGTLEGLGSIEADGSAVRLAIGAALLGAVDSAPSVVCRANGRVLEIASGSNDVLAPPAHEVIAAAREAGIEIQAEPSAISITFPR